MVFFEEGKFYWFYGVVEDRNDPEQLGRVKVRILGVHDKNKDFIPTEDLPWAINLAPSQADFKVKPPIEGSWVFGYFLDGEHAQRPAIFCVVPGIPEETIDSTVGFYDPAQNLADRPKSIESITINTDGTGSSFTTKIAEAFPSRLTEPDTSRLARNSNIDLTIVQTKRDNTIAEVTLPGENPGETGESWAEPNTPYDSVYPYNSVVESESGHVIELDDTPNAERIHEYHRAGTFYEVHPDGSKVSKTVNDQYELVIKDKYVATYGETKTFHQGTENHLHANDVTDQIQSNELSIVDVNAVKRVAENYGIQATQTSIAGDVHLGADEVGADGSPTSPNEEPVVLGDKLVALLEGMIKWLNGHTHATPTGPSGPGQAPPIPNAQTGHPGSLDTDPTIPNIGDLQKLLSEIVKTQ